MKTRQVLVFLLTAVFIIAATSAFVYSNSKKEIIQQKNGIDTINLSELLKNGELHYDNYTIKLKIQNDTASFILNDDKGNFFSRYSYRLSDLKSVLLNLFESEGKRKTYYLNVDTKIVPNAEEEKNYIIKFKNPPLSEKKQLLEKEFDAKKRLLVVNSQGNTANLQKKINDLEVEMKKKL